MTDNAQVKKDAILRDYDALKRAADMSSIQSTITEISTEVTALPDRIQAVRGRGYAFANFLEAKAETLAKQWDAIDQDARAVMEREAAKLSSAMSEMDEKVAKLSAAEGLAAATYINQLEPQIAQLKTTADAAQNSAQSAFGEVPNNVRQTANQLRVIEGYLELIDEAAFQLQAGESIFMAVKAEWQAEHQGKPDGIFYITDKRLVMEQKEKVGKKFGFGGEMKQEVLWESPITSVEDVSYENKGLMGGVDLIHMKFGSGGPYADTTVEVKGGIEAEWFAAQVRRAASGGLEQERGLKLDDAVVEAIVNAPQQCGVCGASFNEPLTQGVNQLKCEYCGAVTRLAV
jgi:hypothetical protein